ncbi:MAG: DUF188 domain-containing protein [Treponema sp.]|nr:DUF188 domain-containing protein [Treponema sp.]MCL2238091.1 DUF188 domain-containing protein [Treponema sp.]
MKSNFKILLDADSCPKPARDLILRRALKMNIRIIFAANHPIPCECEIDGQIYGAEMELCPPTENSADDRIVELSIPGDLAVTRDVPLAKRLVEKDVSVIDDRGRIFTSNNINELLSLRNFAVGLADSGLGMERISNYGKKDLKTFADSLDRLLTKMTK